MAPYVEIRGQASDCYGSGSGWVRVVEGVQEKERKRIGMCRKSFGAGGKQKGLGFNSCVAPSCTQVSYFGKPIRQKRKQGEPKSIFRLEIQEETSEYIY